VRIVVCSLPSPGHTFPLIPLAVAARRAGHDVWYATATDLHPTLERFGLATVAVGVPMVQAFTDPAFGGAGTDAPRPDAPALQERGRRVFGEIYPRVIARDLRPVLADLRPDLLVEEVFNPGAGLAARAAGVARVLHGFGRIRGQFGRGPDPGLAQVAADLGLDLPSTRERVPVVDICPPSLLDPEFAVTAWRVPLRPQALRMPDEPSWQRPQDGRPLIYLTLGTAFGTPQVLSTALAGLAGLGADVLVATGPRVDPAQLAPVPAGVRIEQWVPQAGVLDAADLVVHHGGAGTTLGTAAAGVPQLLLPQGADQFANAQMIAGCGVGRQLPPPEATAERIAAEATALLQDETIRAAAGRLAREIAEMPSADAVASRLPELADR
jgi:UDP:flavonoid glycosyltransferase YjiC (YdhE family)